VSIDRGRINEPAACVNCQAKYSYTLVHNRCLFTDKQVRRPRAPPPGGGGGRTGEQLRGRKTKPLGYSRSNITYTPR
jgi:hypothetical protein